MKDKNEQVRRREDASGEKPVETAERRVNRRDRLNAAEPYPCGSVWVGILGGRPPMWHPVPNLF